MFALTDRRGKLEVRFPSAGAASAAGPPRPSAATPVCPELPSRETRASGSRGPTHQAVRTMVAGGLVGLAVGGVLLGAAVGSAAPGPTASTSTAALSRSDARERTLASVKTSIDALEKERSEFLARYPRAGDAEWVTAISIEDYRAELAHLSATARLEQANELQTDVRAAREAIASLVPNDGDVEELWSSLDSSDSKVFTSEQRLLVLLGAMAGCAAAVARIPVVKGSQRGSRPEARQASPVLTASRRRFVSHLRDTLDHFPAGKGITHNSHVNPLVANDMVAPLIGLHDWIDHVFFGRALTTAGDKVDAYLLGTTRRNYGCSIADLVQFQVDHRHRLDHLAQDPALPVAISDLSPRNKNAYLLRDLQPDELVALAETRERGLERLLPMGTARAREGRERVREKLIGRALREDVFTAEREIQMVPWVLSCLDRLIAGHPPDLAAEAAMRDGLAALNHRYQTDPNAGVLDEVARSELQRTASEQKRLVYDRATQVLKQLDQEAAECNPEGPGAHWPSRWGQKTALGALLARLDPSPKDRNGPDPALGGAATV